MPDGHRHTVIGLGRERVKVQIIILRFTLYALDSGIKRIDTFRTIQYIIRFNNTRSE